jgi:hypothetical protein
MSDRMERIRLFAEEARRWDVEQGRRSEQDRIIKLLISEEVLNPDDEHDQDIIDLIREGDE